jgi:hypothetical protein
MAGRDRLLRWTAALCLTVVPACVHTEGEADEPLVTGAWWTPPADSGPGGPAAVLGKAGVRAANHSGGSTAVPEVADVRVDAVVQAQATSSSREQELLKEPPSRKQLESRQRAERQAPAPEVRSEVRSPPAATVPRPAPEDPPLVMAVRCLLDKRPAEAVKWLERCDSLGKSSQELLLTLLSLAARISEGDLNKMDAHEASTAVTQLDRAANQLRQRAEFIIEKMYFCDEILGFGRFRPLPDDHVFKPRELVQVYVEFRNFASRERRQLHGIELASALEIRELDGHLAFSISPGDDMHPYLSQSPRHDFFINYSFYIPPGLPSNRYTLRIQVTDRPTGRTASSSVGFRVQSNLVRGD